MQSVQLPPELLNLLVFAITAGVTWLVVEGFKGLGEAFDKDFSNIAKIIAAIVSAGVVSTVTGVLNALLALVPAESAPLVQQGLLLVVMLFSAFGIQRRVKLSF